MFNNFGYNYCVMKHYLIYYSFIGCNYRQSIIYATYTYHCVDNYWRLEKTQTFPASWVTCGYRVSVCKSARLFSKEAGVYSQARDRKAHGRICIACLPPKEYHLFHHFAIKVGALTWGRHRVISSRTSDNEDKAAAAINHFYRAQGGASRSRLRTDALSRGCENPTFLRDTSVSGGMNVSRQAVINRSVYVYVRLWNVKTIFRNRNLLNFS